MKPRPPWYLLLPAFTVAALVAVPVAYLFVRGFDADAEELRRILWRRRNLDLLLATLRLAAAVVGFTLLAAIPTAWLTTKTDLPLRRLFVLGLVAPLAIPNYLMAYVLLGLGGQRGVVAQVVGWPAPSFTGFWGATIALSLHFFPYMFLHLRSAFELLDARLLESARSLGAGPWRIAATVVAPHLLPAAAAGALLVALAVIGDFGVVSLMRYETFSFALYQQYHGGYDRVYAAWLAVALLLLAVVFLGLDFWLLRHLRLERSGTLSWRRGRIFPLGRLKLPVVACLALLVGAGTFIPAGTILYWAAQLDPGAWFSAQASTAEWWKEAPAAGSFPEWRAAAGHSLAIALPTALLAAALALPVAFLSQRYRSPLARLAERFSYLGYSIPCLAFGLGVIFFLLRVADPLYQATIVPLFDWAGVPPSLYQTLPILVAALSAHYLAEAVGPIRGALYAATPRLEEAARSLGRGLFGTFCRVTFPLLRGSVVVSVTLVFISAMKELPLTWLLRPIGVETLAVSAWGHADNAEFIAAAPYALAIVLFSSLLLGFLLRPTSHLAR